MTEPIAQPAAAAKPSPGVAAFVLAFIAVGVASLMLYRLGLWLHYRPDDSPGGAELARAFWMGLRFDQVVHRVLDRAVPGAIVIFHESVAADLQALPWILAALHDRGYTLVRLDTWVP